MLNWFVFIVSTAMGPYCVILPNGPAKGQGIHTKVFQTGELWGDPFEIVGSASALLTLFQSYIRREDYDFVAPKNNTHDLIQANDAPSSRTQRGHQFPAAFLVKSFVNITKPSGYCLWDQQAWN